MAGAAHLLNHNAGGFSSPPPSLRDEGVCDDVCVLTTSIGVLRGTHGEQKSPVEQKGKSPLDFDFQCEYKP